MLKTNPTEIATLIEPLEGGRTVESRPSVQKKRPDHSVEMATCTNDRLIQRRESCNQKMARVSFKTVSV